MKKRIVIEVEVVENGLVVRERAGNTWGKRRFVVGFRDKNDISINYSESMTLGNIINSYLFGDSDTKALEKPVMLKQAQN